MTLLVGIAISYLDRQTPPWAIKNIEADILIGNRVKSALDSAFLTATGIVNAGTAVGAVAAPPLIVRCSPKPTGSASLASAGCSS